MAVRTLALFDGYGGFELGLKLALGEHGVRTVARVERESHAAATLVARMAEATLDSSPIWDDIESFDGGPWRGRVDLVTAGFPCQPWSAAGQRRGVDDDRWLWPQIVRVLREVRPSLVFLENVPGLNRAVDGGGLSEVLADLADLGFDAEWSLLSAADIGATHKRTRLWILAVADDHRNGLRRVGWESEHDRDARHDVDRSSRADVADPEGIRQREPHHEARPITRGNARPDTGGRSPWPPRPDDSDGWDRWREQSGPEPSICRSTDGRPVGLAESLHLGGNGLVPAVACHAFTELAMRLGIAYRIDVDDCVSRGAA